MAGRAPPRYVPTLTEVVQAAAPQSAVPAVSAEQLAQRVLQRVDLALDRRVREAIAAAVLEQTSALLPVLRERIETVVREVVAQAVVEELHARQRAPGADL